MWKPVWPSAKCSKRVELSRQGVRQSASGRTERQDLSLKGREWPDRVCCRVIEKRRVHVGGVRKTEGGVGDDGKASL